MREDGKVGAKGIYARWCLGRKYVREDVIVCGGVWEGKSEGEGGDGREGHEIRRMGDG